MPVYMLDKDTISFPHPTLARRDGLLAVGGDLSVERLLLAYTHGIFPWFEPGEEILWWCPKERFVIFPEEIHISRSMKKYTRSHELKVVLNRDFADTMHRCRIKREFAEGTWISDEMEEAYLRLHKEGYALSLEVFEDAMNNIMPVLEGKARRIGGATYQVFFRGKHVFGTEKRFQGGTDCPCKYIAGKPFFIYRLSVSYRTSGKHGRPFYFLGSI